MFRGARTQNMALIGILLCLAVILSQRQQPSGDTNQAEATSRDTNKAEATSRDKNKAEATSRDKNKAEATSRDTNKAEATSRDTNKAEATSRNTNKAEATSRDTNKAEATSRDTNKAEATSRDKNKAEATPRNADDADEGSTTNGLSDFLIPRRKAMSFADEKRTFRRQRYSEEWREERDEEGRTDKDYMKHQCCNWACHYEELEEYAVSRAKLGWENVLGYLCELSIREKKTCRCQSSDKKWGWCGSERMKDECGDPPSGCFDKPARSYRGTRSFTREKKTCQKWNVQTPHRHTNTPGNYKDSGLDENYCRNPTNAKNGPWCYTTDPDQRWDYCFKTCLGDKWTCEASECVGTGKCVGSSLGSSHYCQCIDGYQGTYCEKSSDVWFDGSRDIRGNFFELAGSKYFLIKKEMTWPQAKKTCRQLGSRWYLAWMPTEEQFTGVRNVLYKLHKGSGDSCYDSWIGLSCPNRVDCHWPWSKVDDGFKYIWARGEPDRGCGFIRADPNQSKGHKTQDVHTLRSDVNRCSLLCRKKNRPIT